MMCVGKDRKRGTEFGESAGGLWIEGKIQEFVEKSVRGSGREP